MILTDVELTKLKKQLKNLSVIYQGQGEELHKEDINFLRSMIDKVSNDLTNINKVVFIEVGSKGYVSQIYAGGELLYYYNKYHNLEVLPGLDYYEENYLNI